MKNHASHYRNKLIFVYGKKKLEKRESYKSYPYLQLTQFYESTYGVQRFFFKNNKLNFCDLTGIRRSTRYVPGFIKVYFV